MASSQPRLRIIAGPNGSGKSTLIRDLQQKVSFGLYLNADDIESTLRSKRVYSIDSYGLALSEHSFTAFQTQSALFAKSEATLHSTQPCSASA